MAVSSLPPMMAAAMDRAKAEREAMSSPDPVTRYKAKQRVFERAFIEMGAAMAQQAKANAKVAEQQELEAQRFEREFYKNTYKEIM